MKRLLILVFFLSFCALPVSALDLEAPPVPDSGREWMPRETESFGQGLWSILTDALEAFRPAVASGAKNCAALVGLTLLISSVKLLPGAPEQLTEAVGTVVAAGLLLSESNSMLLLASRTLQELSEYGRLLFPVLTAALTAQGGITASGAIYAGTLAFDSVFSYLTVTLLLPLVRIFLAVSLVAAVTGQTLAGKLRDAARWVVTWSLKLLLYIFTGYMGITGVVSGSTDAAALKATKLAISGMVPLVGGILSDTSEAVLVGAGLVKNAVGIYGMLAVIALWIGPFIEIGSLYLMLKLSLGICSCFPVKSATGLLKDYSAAMGLLLAMTGTLCLLLLISVICFMKGVG